MPEPTRTPRSIVLGLNAWHGDAAAALLVDGRVVCALEEERLRRIQHWAGLPTQSIEACLAEGGVSIQDVDHIAINHDASTNRLAKALHVARHRPSARMLGDRLRSVRRVRGLREALGEGLGVPTAQIRARIHSVEHHRAHLASTYYASPFDRAAVVSVDGFGDYSSSKWGTGRGDRLDILGRVGFPHSLGMYYLALTQYLGFPNYGDELKLMELSAYGEPRYKEQLQSLIQLEPGGGYRLALDYFVHHKAGVPMTWEGGEPHLCRGFSQKLEELLGPAREVGSELTQRHRDLAASVQAVYEGAFFHKLRHLAERTGETCLALSGGCALNSLAAGRIENATPFEEVYLPPSPGDAGGAIGSATWVHANVLGLGRPEPIEHAYLGPPLREPDIDRALRARRDELESIGVGPCRELDLEPLCERVAAHLAAGHVVGWMQGRMEFGPRALGARSILGDPRRSEMQTILNTKIKRRESFRPFAPAVLTERQSEWFERSAPVPFMGRALSIHESRRGEIPAVVHMGGTGRLQSVERATNPRFYQLIEAFEARTGVPILLNTSFQENETMVYRPEEALDCFLRTELDVLVLGNRILERVAMPQDAASQVPGPVPRAQLGSAAA